MWKKVDANGGEHPGAEKTAGKAGAHLCNAGGPLENAGGMARPREPD